MVCSDASSQLSYDTTITKDRKNIVRFNPTPSGIMGFETFVLGYERRIKPHQSLSINIGKLKFKKFIDLGLSQFGIDNQRKSGGWSIVIDYRRYFKKRNRGFAPDGLYWGPCYSYYKKKQKMVLSYNDPSSFTTSYAVFDA
jgi:hypothetical protein